MNPWIFYTVSADGKIFDVFTAGVVAAMLKGPDVHRSATHGTQVRTMEDVTL